MIANKGDAVIDALCTKAREKGLVLMVGAGINGSAAPQWNKLLEKLLKEAALKDLQFCEPNICGESAELLGQWLLRYYDTSAAASIGKRLLGPRYGKAIHWILYGNPQQFNADAFKKYCLGESSDPEGSTQPPVQSNASKYEYLRRIALLCQSPSVVAVVSFNYDDCLENALRHVHLSDPNTRREPVSIVDCDGIPPAMVSTRRTLAKALPIYHVHGYVSSNVPGLIEPSKERIVLSNDEYLRTMRDPMSWETATPVHFLKHYCCVFLGVSFRDWNMLRLVDAACQSQSTRACYCVGCDQSMQMENFTMSQPLRQMAQRIHATLLRSSGVTFISAGKNYADLPSFIGRLGNSMKLQDSGGWKTASS